MARRVYYRGRRVVKRLLGPALPLIRPRRTDLCCCGLSKTGTHSLAGLFEAYRSAHHPDVDVRMMLATQLLQGELDLVRARRELRKRDRLLWLEMESSALAGILIEPLIEACPEKRFILTIRDVYSWCDSWLDHNINSPSSPSSPWQVFDRIRLRVADFEPTRHDAPLTDRGLPPLPCYFQLWTSHNQPALDALSPERLLVVKTDEIVDRLDEIAAFAAVSKDTLLPDRGWLFASPQKNRVLASLDPSYVRETAERFCGSLMAQFFPDADPETSLGASRVLS